ncbi:MAG TPA: AsmA family protein [Rhodocyclaceae bacterium]|nr:AsmA family protein [Rhodocyclaceae bacterium]
MNMPISPRSRRRLHHVAAILAVAGLGVALFDGNLLRGPLARLASAQLGRSVQIAGPVDLHPWSLHPTLSVGGVTVANVTGGRASLLASAGRLAVTADLRALLRGAVVLDALEVDRAEIHLEEDREGRGNWQLGGQIGAGGKDPAAAPTRLRIARVRIHDSRLSAELPSRKTSLQLEVATGDDGRIRFAARGRYQGQDLTVDGEAGSVPGLIDGQLPYPLKAAGTVGATRFRIDGSSADLAGLNGLDVGFELAGRSLAELYPLTGVPLPASPAYRFAARLVQSGTLWRFENIDGTVGRSDLAGTFAVDRGPVPQRLSGTLRARHLDLQDLSGFLGARDSSGERLAPRPGKVLPARPLGFDKIAAADVDLDFAIGDIRHSGLPLDAASGHLRIVDRRVLLQPLRVGMAQGEGSGVLELETRGMPARARLDLQASRLKLRELMPTLESRSLTTGVLGGRATVSMRGNSVAALLGSATGDLALAMDGGSTSRLLVRLANLDVANAFVSWLAGGQREDIRCLVGDFSARDGVLEPRALLLDTERTLIRGEGQINLRDETLDLRLRASARDGSLLSLRGPLHLDGSFADPKVLPEPVPLGSRVAGAVALGLISPPLALLPLLEAGDARESACKRLLQQAGKTMGRP